MPESCFLFLLDLLPAATDIVPQQNVGLSSAALPRNDAEGHDETHAPQQITVPRACPLRVGKILAQRGKEAAN